jgi:hypothetical protein
MPRSHAPAWKRLSCRSEACSMSIREVDPIPFLSTRHTPLYRHPERVCVRARLTTKAPHITIIMILIYTTI